DLVDTTVQQEIYRTTFDTKMEILSVSSKVDELRQLVQALTIGVVAAATPSDGILAHGLKSETKLRQKNEDEDIKALALFKEDVTRIETKAPSAHSEKSLELKRSDFKL